MKWKSVRVVGAQGRAREEIVSALMGAGTACVQEDGGALLTMLPDDADLTAVRDAVAAAQSTTIECLDVAPEVMARRWVPRVGINRLGRLTIAPPWLAGEAGDPNDVVVIDPAMAFGTGEHATTRGVIRLMQSIVRSGDRVADLGAGSAVLAIAAAKLGATRIAAIENDVDAIGNAEGNVALNGVGDRVKVLLGDARVLLPLVAPVDLIVANIISSVLAELLPVLRDGLASGGRAILSGILMDEREQFVDVLDASRWSVCAEDSEDGWWSTVIAPR